MFVTRGVVRGAQISEFDDIKCIVLLNITDVRKLGTRISSKFKLEEKSNTVIFFTRGKLRGPKGVNFII